MPAPRGNFVPFELDDILDEDYDKEHMGKRRKIELDGNVVHIDCEDPYGFWYVKLKKGQVPERLKGAYTTFDAALTAVNTWLKNKKEPISFTKPVKET